MLVSNINFIAFPKTEPPPHFVGNIVDVFRANEDRISTTVLNKGLKSDEVLSTLGTDLIDIGFDIERGKGNTEKLDRPVFFGENGEPTLRYEIDAFHANWKCGLEIEAGRAFKGNAVYKDLIRALVMVEVEHLVLAVPNGYRFSSSGKPIISRDYRYAVSLGDALYGHSRMRLPYRLIVIGY